MVWYSPTILVVLIHGANQRRTFKQILPRHLPNCGHFGMRNWQSIGHRIRIRERAATRRGIEQERPRRESRRSQYFPAGIQTWARRDKATYSSVCGEFASYGFVVVSLEHRDGSGPRTFINLPKDDPNIESGKVDSTPQGRARGYSRMDYVFPQHNARQ
jgi:hypothetical protein